MPFRFYFLFVFLINFSCEKKEHADLLILDANIYTVDENFSKAGAIAVKDGKIVEVGSTDVIRAKYESDNALELEGKTVVPGFIDSHCHFYNLGFGLNSVNLVGTKSLDEVVERVVSFQKEHYKSIIYGRGWDQNDWEDKEFPTNEKLNELFPDTPIALKRIDGHAALFNEAAIRLANITKDTKINGGEILFNGDRPTGVFIDNAQGLVYSKFPSGDVSEAISSLMDAQDMCLSYGLTTVDDAGLSPFEIGIIDSLQKVGELKIRVYAMVSANRKNLDYYLERGPYKTDKLNVRSFKAYGDGALGSRGALLREPYSDLPGHYGLAVTSLDTLTYIANRLGNSEFQMNTHAIGDSANHALLNIYKEALEGSEDRRWRIEHAQIVSPEDFKEFNDIIPSVQPTHATSDMYWAEDRVGSERIKGAYANKYLLNANGVVALGTDFPVEQVNPFLTFYAAVARQDLENYPDGGFQMENALTREETLKGMTIWGAFVNFEETEKGSIEVGKFADFIVLDKNIMEVPIDEVPSMEVDKTFIAGELVYELPRKE
ncbi:amidohydrolase [Aegicerativicinus sediminis]|uniref:amidohydrolase n=1 Tax=Aegicerativicinus sediminis TaxID=2893202 RepID=UPI001E3977F5|nr:amidohydrolase [Aegicerativicinus sediminis]